MLRAVLVVVGLLVVLVFAAPNMERRPAPDMPAQSVAGAGRVAHNEGTLNAPLEWDEPVLNALRLARNGSQVTTLYAPIMALGDRAAEIAEDPRGEMEALILDHVRPLPAANAEANRAGYAALRPETAVYAEKVAQYTARIEQARRRIVDSLNRRVDDFSGSTWYKHQSFPRYTDTRSYIQPYIGVKNNRVWLRFRLNYTAENWLFVERAEANIDGQRFNLPVGRFERDNDSEIWEWVDETPSEAMIAIMRRIGESKKTTIRFYGSQYYDDYVVRANDKTAIRDILLAFEVLSES